MPSVVSHVTSSEFGDVANTELIKIFCSLEKRFSDPMASIGVSSFELPMTRIKIRLTVLPASFSAAHAYQPYLNDGKMIFLG